MNLVNFIKGQPTPPSKPTGIIDAITRGYNVTCFRDDHTISFQHQPLGGYVATWLIDIRIHRQMHLSPERALMMIQALQEKGCRTRIHDA